MSTPFVPGSWLDLAWTTYKNLFDNYIQDIEDAESIINKYKDASYANAWSDTKSLIIDSSTIFRDYCEDASQPTTLIRIEPEKFGTCLFWKEYWTLNLIAMSLIFGDKMAARLNTKLHNANWNYTFRLNDSRTDIGSVLLNWLNPVSCKKVQPHVQIIFPNLIKFLTEPVHNLESGNFVVEFCPDITQAPVLSVNLSQLGKSLKQEFIERCSLDIK